MLEKYYQIGQAIGISINILGENRIQISACEIVVENNALDFKKKIVDLVNLEDLKKHFTPGSFASLNLSGRGILQKQVEKIESIDQSNFGKILPNARIDDFYIQNFISGELSFISIIRKAEVDKWIVQLTTLGLKLVMLSLGPFPVQNIISQLNIYDSDLIFNGNIIQRNEQQEWINFNYNETARTTFPLKVESETINEKLVVAYATVFQLVLASSLQPIQANVPELTIALNSVVEKKKLKVKGVIILAIFFILLLVNFLTWSWLNSANTKLAEAVSLSTQSTIDVQSITDSIKHKEITLQSLGWDDDINKAILIDQIAALLPVDVAWQEVDINPIDVSASRIQRMLVFADRQISIIGTSARIIPVNEWLARVKTKAWVKNIQLDNYTFNNELNTGEFKIVINY